LTPSHKYFIQYVGEHLELDSSVVEDFVLDSAEVMQAFNILLLKSLSARLCMHTCDSNHQVTEMQ